MNSGSQLEALQIMFAKLATEYEDVAAAGAVGQGARSIAEAQRIAGRFHRAQRSTTSLMTLVDEALR